MQCWRYTARVLALVNNGFDGIAVKKGEKYDFSVFSKVLDDTKGGKVLVRLTTKDGKEIAQAAIRVSSTEWKKQKAVLTATADACGCRVVRLSADGWEVCLGYGFSFPTEYI